MLSKRINRIEDPYTTGGVSHLTSEVVIMYLKRLWEVYQKPIISIGSGAGYIEYLAKKEIKGVDIVCCDPDPIKWKSDKWSETKLREPFSTAEYNTADDLVKNHPHLIGDCVVLLNWCFPGDSTYDYDAIVALKPLAVLTIYEDDMHDMYDMVHDPSGAAGGDKFHKWMCVQEGFNDLSLNDAIGDRVPDYTKDFKKEYAFAASCYYVPYDEAPWAKINIRMKLLVVDETKKELFDGLPICVYDWNHDETYLLFDHEDLMPLVEAAKGGK